MDVTDPSKHTSQHNTPPPRQVLNRVPHVAAPGILGWTELARDPDHGPHINSQRAIERGGVCSYRMLWFPGVLVTDPVLAQHVLKTLDLPKSRMIYRTWNAVWGRSAAFRVALCRC